METEHGYIPFSSRVAQRAEQCHNFRPLGTKVHTRHLSMRVHRSMWVRVNSHQATNTYGGAEVQLHVFLTSAIDGDEWSVLFPRGNNRIYYLNTKQGGPQRGSVLADE